MSYSYEVSRTLEVNSMEGVYEKVKKDFLLPHISRKITYNTPNGSFSISLQVTDKRQYEVTLLTQEQMIKYQGACGNQYELKFLSKQQAMADFCKSTMQLKFEEGFEDNVLKDKLTHLMQKHNQVFSPGITSMPKHIDKGYFGFIDDHGTIRQFRAFIVSGQGASLKAHMEIK
jgi:hypothetical protein